MDDSYAVTVGISNTVDTDLFSLDSDCAGIRNIYSAEYFDKGGFSCAIFAQKSMNFAALQVKSTSSSAVTPPDLLVTP